jgi:hypothetical protein
MRKPILLFEKHSVYDTINSKLSRPIIKFEHMLTLIHFHACHHCVMQRNCKEFGQFCQTEVPNSWADPQELIENMLMMCNRFERLVLDDIVSDSCWTSFSKNVLKLTIGLIVVKRWNVQRYIVLDYLFARMDLLHYDAVILTHTLTVNVSKSNSKAITMQGNIMWSLEKSRVALAR